MPSTYSKRNLLSGLFFAGLAAAGLISSALPPNGLAQTTPSGITIFGGVDPDYRLAYTIQYNTRRSTRARYYLRVPANKLRNDVVELEIAYPERFTELRGEVDIDNIEVRKGRGKGDDAIPLDDIVLDTERSKIVIYPQEPIPSDTSLVIVLSQVRNPNRVSIHYFNLKVLFQGDVLRSFVGIWPVEAGSESGPRD